jgi:hypothetical protein
MCSNPASGCLNPYFSTAFNKTPVGCRFAFLRNEFGSEEAWYPGHLLSTCR